MRKAVIFCIAILLVLLLSPVFASIMAKPKETAINSDTEKIIAEALLICEEDFCDEALKAILAIAENNCSFLKEENHADRDYSEEFEKRLKKIYKETDVSIAFDEKQVYIPTATLSKGYTKTDGKYPYIKSVASPWDCFNEDFVFEKEYSCGVSLEGLNYLCKEGLSYKEALKWYLPDFDIK